MANLINYTTPYEFAKEYSKVSSEENLKNIRTLSLVFFLVSVIIRTLAFIFISNKIDFINYDTYSAINWVQMSTTFVFFLISSYLFHKKDESLFKERFLTIIFCLFIITIAMVVSYQVSLYNTKNTLTIFFLSIVLCSLFFNLRFYEILSVSTAISCIYWIMILQSPIHINEKVMNVFVGLVFGTTLFVFSRYTYYFKSQQFVRIKLLELKNQEIESLHIQQGEILSFVAHDLRAPISNIEALAQLIKEQNRQENPNNSDEIELLIKSTEQAKNIIHDLIDVIKTKPGELIRKELDLNIFICEFVEKWKKQCNRIINVEGIKLGTLIVANSSKLERVLDNLVSNANKFSYDDKPITIRCNYDDNFIKIQVIDNGIGIPKDMMDHIFSQFTPAGRTGLKGEKSIGLGLHIAKRIMEQHHGYLKVESEEQKGTTFTMWLPATT